MIANQNGIFPIVVFDDTDKWAGLINLVYPDLDSRGLDRLMRVLESACKCVVVERHYIDKDYRDTFSNFHSKRFNTPSSRCTRLHFFSSTVTEGSIADMEAATVNAYLGYSVIRPTKPNCIGRTLLDHRLRLQAAAHVSICKEEVNLMGSRFEIGGFPFISQDTDATVCAESSLWMLLRYYSNRYNWYSEILPFQITNLAANHAVGSRVYPSPGLASWQLAEALRLQRFSPVVYSRKQIEVLFPDQPDLFNHLLYTYVESGLPLLVTLPGHVVTAYGHLSDYAAPLPSESLEFIWTSHFNRAFVISDDNCFPYQMLHCAGKAAATDSQHGWKNIEEFIVPLPEKVFLTAEQVRSAIMTLLRNVKVGIDALSAKLAGKNVLLRLFLTSARSFKRRLRSRGMGNQQVESAYRSLPMPHFIWICELAEYGEYAKEKRVLGEVIWDATRNSNEPDGWIALHYPEILILDVGSALNGLQHLVEVPLNDSKSYCLFNSNLHTL